MKNHPVFKNNWLSLYLTPCEVRFTFGPASYFDNRWHIVIYFFFFKLYIDLPIRSKYDQCDPPEYGFYFFSEGGVSNHSSLRICLGNKGKYINFPWSLVWVRTAVLIIDAKDADDNSHKIWACETPKRRHYFFTDFWKKLKYTEVHPYRYVTDHGEIQQRTATVTVEEREWRMRWFKFTKLGGITHRTIAVEFDQGTGESVDSWKGGTIGCGWPLREGETPLQALRRMEVMRRFR